MSDTSSTLVGIAILLAGLLIVLPMVIGRVEKQLKKIADSLDFLVAANKK